MRPWIRPDIRQVANLRLLCLPPAGGGAQFYRRWRDHLAPAIDVLPVHLPGREDRITDAPYRDYRRMVSDLTTGLAPVFERPYALFGHSMGAFLAFGIARAQRDRQLPQPERLIVSGVTAPHRYDIQEAKKLAQMDDHDLIKDLAENGGTPHEILDSQELLDLILPTLRADYDVCATIAKSEPEPFDFPISVLGGTDDKTSVSDLRAWAAWSTKQTTVRTFRGGHFFLASPSTSAVLKTIQHELNGRTSVAGEHGSAPWHTRWPGP